MNRTGLFTGSFDPFTNGHLTIAHKSLKIFDKLVICILNHPNKKSFLELKDRVEIIEDIFQNDKRVEVGTSDKLTIEYAKKVKADAIVRGLRNTIDFENEKNMAIVNNFLEAGIDTIFFLADLKLSFLSSSLIRELASYHQNLNPFLSLIAQKKVNEKINNENN